MREIGSELKDLRLHGMASAWADLEGMGRISPSSLAALLDMQQQELAKLAGVHRNTLRTHPESPRLQESLRNLIRILLAALVVHPDRQRAIFLLKNEPIAAFGHKTLLGLVAEDRVDDAVAYLDSIASGFVG